MTFSQIKLLFDDTAKGWRKIEVKKQFQGLKLVAKMSSIKIKKFVNIKGILDKFGPVSHMDHSFFKYITTVQIVKHFVCFQI